jgi:hypothetical protein
MFSEEEKNRLNNELMKRNVYTYFIVAIDTFNIILPYHQLYLSFFVSPYGYSIFMASVLGNSISCTYSIVYKYSLKHA